MSGAKNLENLIKEMKPHLNKGEYVFTTVNNLSKINTNDIIGPF